MSEDSTRQDSIRAKLAEPTWRYNPEDRRLLVTIDASVSSVHAGLPTCVRSAIKEQGTKLLLDLRQQVAQAGFETLHEATKSGNVRQVIKEALAKDFSDITANWWKDLSDTDLVTPTIQPGASASSQDRDITSRLDVLLSGNTAKLGTTDDADRTTIRLQVRRLREHEYKLPLSPLTYMTPRGILWMGLPKNLICTTGGLDLSLPSDAEGMKRLQNFFNASLEEPLNKVLATYVDQESTEECLYGAMPKRAVDELAPEIVQTVLKYNRMSSSGEQQQQVQLSLPQGKSGSFVMRMCSGNVDLNTGTLYSKHMKAAPTCSQTPPRLWLCQEPKVEYLQGILTLTFGGCCTSTAPGSLSTLLDQIPTSDALDSMLKGVVSAWESDMFNRWSQVYNESNREAIAHQLASDLALFLHCYTKSGELRGFSEGDPVFTGTCQVAPSEGAPTSVVVQWTPKRCIDVDRRP